MLLMGNCVFATSLLLLHTELKVPIQNCVIDLKQVHHLIQHVEIHSFS